MGQGGSKRNEQEKLDEYVISAYRIGVWRKRRDRAFAHAQEAPRN